jgi:hypothetical protein
MGLLQNMFGETIPATVSSHSRKMVISPGLDQALDIDACRRRATCKKAADKRVPLVIPDFPLGLSAFPALSNQEQVNLGEFLDSRSVITHQLVDFLDREMIELNDLGVMAISGRQYRSCLFFAVHIHREPCLVVAILAAPVGVRKEMRTALEKDLDHFRAGQGVCFVWNFDQKS